MSSWALPRDSSSDEEEGSEGDEEDAEFLEHRWLVALQAMAVSQPHLHQQIQDIRCVVGPVAEVQGRSSD